MEPRVECMVPPWGEDEDPDHRGPEHESENGSSELLPNLNRPYHEWDEHGRGFYYGCKIVSWWRDGKQPDQSWWVKVAIEGSSPEHHEWRPYVELGAPEPKRRKETKEWASGAVDWSGEGVPFEWESES